VLSAVADAFAKQSAVSIVDLACGLGSTLRTFAPLLKSRQTWKLVDNDLSLLSRTPRSTPPDLMVTTIPIDLDRDLEVALDGPVDLVTTSALLDLVSDQWLQRLAVEAAARRLPIYAALSYDGRVEFSPSDTADDRIVTAVNTHQRTDKGFGLALGPDAADAAVKAFERVGYDVVQGRSDWIFGSQDREIQLEVLSGWAHAAREIGEVPLNDIIEWLTRRRDHVAAGRSSIRVGHVDLFAKPTGSR
jgi:hypothetical protein